jgi:hypothetical protein
MRKKDKVDNEKEVGYHSGFDLEDIECEEPSLFLRPRPVINPFLETHCQKYLPPTREVTINQN